METTSIELNVDIKQAMEEEEIQTKINGAIELIKAGGIKYLENVKYHMDGVFRLVKDSYPSNESESGIYVDIYLILLDSLLNQVRDYLQISERVDEIITMVGKHQNIPIDELHLSLLRKHCVDVTDHIRANRPHSIQNDYHFNREPEDSVPTAGYNRRNKINQVTVDLHNLCI